MIPKLATSPFNFKYCNPLKTAYKENQTNKNTYNQEQNLLCSNDKIWSWKNDVLKKTRFYKAFSNNMIN